MPFDSLRDALRWFAGRDAKERSVFESEKEAYEFVTRLYRESGGVTPELKRAYESYVRNSGDGCDRPIRINEDTHQPAR